MMFSYAPLSFPETLSDPPHPSIINSGIIGFIERNSHVRQRDGIRKDKGRRRDSALVEEE